jgi:hypothetical protein
MGTAMAFVEINPRYRAFLEGHGLVSAAQFLALPGALFCGHPDRNVARTLIGTGPEALPAYLKREHAVLWRTRLANAWAGFGFVSRSTREARLLQALHRARTTRAGHSCWSVSWRACASSAPIWVPPPGASGGGWLVSWAPPWRTCMKRASSNPTCIPSTCW